GALGTLARAASRRAAGPADGALPLRDRAGGPGARRADGRGRRGGPDRRGAARERWLRLRPRIFLPAARPHLRRDLRRGEASREPPRKSAGRGPTTPQRVI